MDPIANIAAQETASFNYEDWYNHSSRHRAARVWQACLLGRVLTEDERNEWRKQHETEVEAGHYLQSHGCKACERCACDEHKLKDEEWM